MELSVLPRQQDGPFLLWPTTRNKQIQRIVVPTRQQIWPWSRSKVKAPAWSCYSTVIMKLLIWSWVPMTQLLHYWPIAISHVEFWCHPNVMPQSRNYLTAYMWHHNESVMSSILRKVNCHSKVTDPVLHFYETTAMRPKNIYAFPITCLKIFGSVGRLFFYFCFEECQRATVYCSLPLTGERGLERCFNLLVGVAS